MYSFYTEGGQAVLTTLAAFALLYTLPVVVMYLYVNKRYGFRFYGGIKDEQVRRSKVFNQGIS